MRPPTSAFDIFTASTTLESGMPRAARRSGSRSTWYSFTNPPTLATSATPGTACRAYRMFQSCSDWSCCRVTCPVLSISAYSKTQPTPVAYGPRMGVTPWGSLLEMVDSFSSTRLRAQYRSVPSSKMTFTNDIPNMDWPRTAVTRGDPSIELTTG